MDAILQKMIFQNFRVSKFQKNQNWRKGSENQTVCKRRAHVAHVLLFVVVVYFFVAVNSQWVAAR